MSFGEEYWLNSLGRPLRDQHLPHSVICGLAAQNPGLKMKWERTAQQAIVQPFSLRDSVL